MSGENAHIARADEAIAAARALRVPHPAWALVPLFYSAMHLMHARFDADQLPTDRRHPDRHNSYRPGGSIVAWGTTDVVRQHYSTTISRAYTSLVMAGHATRYSSPLRGNGDRLWQDYDVISRFVRPAQ